MSWAFTRRVKTPTPETETRAAKLGMSPDELRRYEAYHGSMQFGR